MLITAWEQRDKGLRMAERGDPGLRRALSYHRSLKSWGFSPHSQMACQTVVTARPAEGEKNSRMSRHGPVPESPPLRGKEASWPTCPG